MTVQVGLCQTWSETPKTGFLASRLISISNSRHYRTILIPDLSTIEFDKFQHPCLIALRGKIVDVLYYVHYNAAPCEYRTECVMILKLRLQTRALKIYIYHGLFHGQVYIKSIMVI